MSLTPSQGKTNLGKVETWLDVSFSLDRAETSPLILKLVHSWDYGIYKIKLDGRQLAQLDLYSPTPTEPISHSLGRQSLEPGLHTLRFEGVGHASSSAGYYLGFDSLVARKPVYARGPDEDLRKLQKP